MYVIEACSYEGISQQKVIDFFKMGIFTSCRGTRYYVPKTR